MGIFEKKKNTISNFMNHPNIYRFSKNITYLLLRLWFQKEASRLKEKEAIAEKEKSVCDDLFV